MKMKKIDNFKYLGKTIDQDGYSERKIMKKVSTRTKLIGILNDIRRIRNIINKKKTNVHHSVFENMLLYGAETSNTQKK